MKMHQRFDMIDSDEGFISKEKFHQKKRKKEHEDDTDRRTRRLIREQKRGN